MKIALTSYATGKFLPYQKELNESATRWGIAEIFSYGRGELEDSEFYRENKSILDEPCGAGLWAWKPFFILKALEHLGEGDLLLYCDSGSRIVQDPSPLFKIGTEQPAGLVLFDARPLTNRQFTKRECFVEMGCDREEYWDATKVIATALLVRKCSSSLKMIEEWQGFCRARAAIANERVHPEILELPGYIQHRNDQSILSVLAKKYNLETYRNPSHWGDYLKLPAFRVKKEKIKSPFGLPLGIKKYAREPQANSPYGTVFEFNRLLNLEHKETYDQSLAKPVARRRGPVGLLILLKRIFSGKKR